MKRRIQEYTTATLSRAISGSPSTVLIYFGTDWCAPCKRLERVLMDLSSDLGDSITVGKVNVEDEPVLAGTYSVTRSPTVCLFESGELVARREGFTDRPDLLALVQNRSAH